MIVVAPMPSKDRGHGLSRCSRRNTTSYMWSKSSDLCIDQLKGSSLHAKRSFSSICLAHDILYKRVSIAFSRHFQFSSVTRTHPLSLSSYVNLYRFSFFINTPSSGTLFLSTSYSYHKIDNPNLPGSETGQQYN